MDAIESVTVTAYVSDLVIFIPLPTSRPQQKIDAPSLPAVHFSETPNPEIRNKKYVCDLLASCGYDPKKAWSIANADRKTKTNGKTNWNNPTYREGENWLTAASGFFPIPFAYEAQIYTWQYHKLITSSGTTPFSQNALDAGLDGLKHLGDSPEQLKKWCNDGK